MKEIDLIKAKAAKGDWVDVGAELLRIKHALPNAQSASAIARYKTRLAIYGARWRELEAAGQVPKNKFRKKGGAK